MKPQHRSIATALMAAITLWLTALPGRAQDVTVTISAAEFQAMVYSGQVLTTMDEKPELDACLQVLLELQRRNPHADPAALADLSRVALQRYRTNEPLYVRTLAYRDEILAAYLDALRQVPAHTNFVPATLSMLSHFLLGPTDYTNASPAELIHSGNQRLLASEGEASRRQALVDACTSRAHSNAVFAAAMDNLLLPETLFPLAATPAAIIGSTNSALHDNVTMQTLLTLSLGSGNGSLTVSSNQLLSLFANETQTLWDTIHTNLALEVEFNQSHPDLLAFLGDQAAIDADVQRNAAVKAGQARKIAASTAAILTHRTIAEAQPQHAFFKLPKKWQGTVDCIGKIAGGLSALNAKSLGGDPTKATTLGRLSGGLTIVSGALSLVGLFTDSGESPEQSVVREIGNVKTLIQDLSTNINYRFDRVDQSLVTIFDTLNTEFDKIELTLDAQGHQIARLNGSVDEIRGTLVAVQTDLHRLERHLLNYLNELDARGLNTVLNTYLGYEAAFALPMRYQEDYIPSETAFFTQARNNSVDGLSAPYLDRDYSATGLFDELTESSGGSVTNRLEQNINYIKNFLAGPPLFQPTAGTLPLANPRDWFTGAYAYLQLAAENPAYFRRVNPGTRLDNITARGEDLTNFFRSLTFTSGAINSNLYIALTNYYAAQLPSFFSQVQAKEQQYANDTSFALNTWRQWDTAAARTTTATDVLQAEQRGLPLLSRGATRLAAGDAHSLALKANGTVVGWGDNANGQVAIPAGLGNVLEIAAGANHSLAIKSDRTVAGWGYNGQGQASPPASATNVIAVSGGTYHSLALRTDGTIVGWGYNGDGQTTVPGNAANAVQIAAGWGHSLALKSDRTVVGWGYNGHGEATTPPIATNVVAIAAGDYHNLALRADGRVVGWGYNGNSQATGVPGGNPPNYGATGIVTVAGLALTDVKAIAAGGFHSLALRSNGTVVAWGYNGHGQTRIPTGLTNVVAIAAGFEHNLALKADGAVVAWGDNSSRQCAVPGVLTWPGAISASFGHLLTLNGDGTVAGWGTNSSGQINIPSSATNILAVAAGGHHSLALKADRTLVAWGDNLLGQITIPASASNVVAIAAGDYHNLALRADGTVAVWGDNTFGELSIPSNATNVVAISAGFYYNMVLRADGTIVAWGLNSEGQTSIPASATNVVAIAAGVYHNLALRGDGTIVAWGYNGYGETSVPASATNVVAVAVGLNHSLALKADGTVVSWGDDRFGQTSLLTFGSGVVAIGAAGNQTLAITTGGFLTGWGVNIMNPSAIPANATNLVAIAAGRVHSLGLKANGTVVAWGNNFAGQNNIPGSATNVLAVAGGAGYSLALKADGTVIGWGDNSSGQISVPATANNVVAIAAGAFHGLALKANGLIEAWGSNQDGETTIPVGATNVVALAAGEYHSLALRANGTVVAWGYNDVGQTNVPANAINVVAIAAGRSHSLALKADGTVVGWGKPSYVPPSAINVVAIAAAADHSLAVRADGTVLTWGYSQHGLTALPPGISNVMAIAAGDYHSLFLTSRSSSSTGPSVALVRAQIPRRVSDLIRGADERVLTQLGLAGDFQTAATGLSGPKALLLAVLELGMPYTMERDDVLHGFFYGSEALVDLNSATAFLQAEIAKLQSNPQARPQALTDVAVLRYQRFAQRLSERLLDLRAAGQPELPRLVGHTLRLLYQLRDSWGTVPPSALEIGRVPSGVGLNLYGEPYARYAVQQSSSLSGWANASITVTNLRSADSPIGIIATNLPIAVDPARFYRAVQPVP